MLDPSIMETVTPDCNATVVFHIRQQTSMCHGAVGWPRTYSWCCMSSAFWMPVSALSLGPLLLVRDVTHVAHVVSKCGSGTRCMSGVSSPFCFSRESSDTGGYHAGWLQHLHTMNEKAKKVTEMILLKACTY